MLRLFVFLTLGCRLQPSEFAFQIPYTCDQFRQVAQGVVCPGHIRHLPFVSDMTRDRARL